MHTQVATVWVLGIPGDAFSKDVMHARRVIHELLGAVLESLVRDNLGGREASLFLLPLQEYEDRGNTLVRWRIRSAKLWQPCSRGKKHRGDNTKQRRGWQKAFRFIANGQSIKRQPPREFNEWKQLSRWH